jgi:hypothetical protein
VIPQAKRKSAGLNKPLQSHSPPGQKSSNDPMGLSIRIRWRYGLTPSAHFGTILSIMDGGAIGREAAGSTSSEVSPGGGVGEGGIDELYRRVEASGDRTGRRGMTREVDRNPGRPARRH